MAILPVIDLLHGQVVRGIAGRRSEYRPIVSRLTPSADPLAVARAFRTHFGLSEFYVADLDAIQTGTLNHDAYQCLSEDGFTFWLDAGVATADGPVLDMVLAVRPAAVIAGLETVAGPTELERMHARLGGDRLVFSLDLKSALPLGRTELWETADPQKIAERAIALGVQRLIVLDLARVGVGGGTGTEELCSGLRNAFAHVELTAGGGVRGIADVRRLMSLGVNHVLVASALHDGAITAEDVRSI